ncbi:hypothetical protein COO60DRAFT_902339 [Scenedesmus sp. NREL 46B-D3]|nr:hypothetical protein COO60DRAFT_902339 [Scenedesmus sp. NREL 46B-D3]
MLQPGQGASSSYAAAAAAAAAAAGRGGARYRQHQQQHQQLHGVAVDLGSGGWGGYPDDMPAAHPRFGLRVEAAAAATPPPAAAAGQPSGFPAAYTLPGADRDMAVPTAAAAQAAAAEAAAAQATGAARHGARLAGAATAELAAAADRAAVEQALPGPAAAGSAGGAPAAAPGGAAPWQAAGRPASPPHGDFRIFDGLADFDWDFGAAQGSAPPSPDLLLRPPGAPAAAARAAPGDYFRGPPNRMHWEALRHLSTTPPVALAAPDELAAVPGVAAPADVAAGLGEFHGVHHALPQPAARATAMRGSRTAAAWDAVERSMQGWRAMGAQQGHAGAAAVGSAAAAGARASDVAPGYRQPGEEAAAAAHTGAGAGQLLGFGWSSDDEAIIGDPDIDLLRPYRQRQQQGSGSSSSSSSSRFTSSSSGTISTCYSR